MSAIRGRPTRLWAGEATVATGTIAFGWYGVVDQAFSDGWSGTGWLALLAVISTAGAAVGLIAARLGAPLVAALGLGVAAVAPTGFAYLGNVALLLLAATELTLPRLRRVRAGRAGTT